MGGFSNFYQRIPEHLNPNFSVGFFSVSWYAVMYLVGFGVVYALLRYRIRKGEYVNSPNSPNYLIFNKIPNSKYQISNKIQNSKFKIQNKTQEDALISFLVYSFFGLLIGARLGYVIFYDLAYFINNPFAIISPFDGAGNFVGIYGMSYHGGLLGVFLVSIIFLRRYKIDFWQWADFVVPAIPAGYFFGRIGNFLNGELYGRITQKPWGMYFSDENGDVFPYLRHPSQLYEAFLEGVVLFAILWTLRNKKFFEGKLLGVYFIGYALARFAVEFFREPDEQIGFVFSVFTMGQVLSLAMVIFGTVLLLRIPKKWYTE
ncbi:MAG: Phosphatidylglycerol--prolipoprotein diacylglyceryl transferase [Patescibacteria group bacterium]|nr:Phosphatidylglycerol--prolipoprotein diacylglyceryl transferase [Patescibacteria group bacterium]